LVVEDLHNDEDSLIFSKTKIKSTCPRFVYCIMNGIHTLYFVALPTDSVDDQTCCFEETMNNCVAKKRKDIIRNGANVAR
jgi:hypothetical protein